MPSRRGALIALTGACLAIACGKKDQDTELRDRWITDETAAHKVYLRRFLNGTPDVSYFDGWYPLESDPKTGGAWRWMGERSITRLRTGAPRAHDMNLTIYGWTAHEHVGVRTEHMDFYINGWLLEHFEPPDTAFQHTIFVPKWLLDRSEWVDFIIKVANSAVPSNDWRALGFATTGIIWNPAGKQ